ncbi:MAG: autotransporter outer membrane beta-barrel domain-containing protein [Prevotella sp.]|nr:autotransporter outer membrane beta-barrel domain-containing protein [Prevotella sp.]
MMRYLISLLMFLMASSMLAQDVIRKKDGTTVQSRVLEIGSEEVTYTEWGDATETVYAVAVSELLCINFANGETEVFARETVDENKDNGQSGISFEFGFIDGGGQVGMDYVINGFVLGGSFGWGETNAVVKSNSSWDIHIGYNYRYFLHQNVYIEGRALFGYGSATMETLVGKTREKNTNGDVFLGLNPRIGVCIPLGKNFNNISIFAGYRWDIVKFQFDKEHTGDYFNIGFCSVF